MMIPFYLPIILLLRNGASQTSVNIPPPDEDQIFEQYALDPSSIIACNYESGFLLSVNCLLIYNSLEDGFL